MLTMKLDGPTRIEVTLEDGTLREVVALEVRVAGVVRARRPPAASAEKPREKGEAAPRVYTPFTDPLTTERVRSVAGGEIDAHIIVDGRVDHEKLGLLVAVLNYCRKRAFKTGATTATRQEIEALRDAVRSGVLPSTLCRGVAAASREAFWRRAGDIRIGKLVANIGALTSESKRDWKVTLRAMVPKIKDADPFDGTDIEERMARDEINDDEARGLVEVWKKKLEGGRG